MKIRSLIIGILLINVAASSFAQDTLSLSLAQAEQMFLAKNARLIAQKYETEEAKAAIITARLFDNPELSYENLFYNHETGRFLETSMATGQYNASITQIIRLAGKRNKNIQLAKTGAELAESAFADLMRTLRYELRSTYYKAYYTQLSVVVYEQQVRSLQKLLSASENQLERGNIAQKDIIRIKSRLYSLMGEYASVQNELQRSKSELKLLVRLEPRLELVLNGDRIDPDAFKPWEKSYPALLDSAKANRADLQLARTEMKLAENLLSVQKSMAVPDIAISLSYDLKGNYPEKYTGLGISMPIPLFDRNQGEIRKAKIGIDASKSGLNRREEIVANELYNSYHTALKTAKLYSSLDTTFSQSFEKLMTGVTNSFQSRNISLVEFLDFYDAYKETASQVNNLKYELMNAKETINFHAGTTIFK
ncbi:TolC family protein [Arcticibacter sp.]|uniref:TolC family protein n=1 Tax=Arcticibacter sp. TaxID=1872630 RepID=UPI00388D543C